MLNSSINQVVFPQINKRGNDDLRSLPSRKKIVFFFRATYKYTRDKLISEKGKYTRSYMKCFIIYFYIRICVQFQGLLIHFCANVKFYFIRVVSMLLASYLWHKITIISNKIKLHFWYCHKIVSEYFYS